MQQTLATKQALLRDKNLCRWCLHRHIRIRDVHASVDGYHPDEGGGYHVFGRGRVDHEDAIIGLCSEHHYKAQRYIIYKREIVELLSKIVGYDLHEKYREFCDW